MLLVCYHTDHDLGDMVMHAVGTAFHSGHVRSPCQMGCRSQVADRDRLRPRGEVHTWEAPDSPRQVSADPRRSVSAQSLQCAGTQATETLRDISGSPHFTRQGDGSI